MPLPVPQRRGLIKRRLRRVFGRPGVHVHRHAGAEAAGAPGLVSLRAHSTLGDRAEYAFKHVLVRDVAYAGSKALGASAPMPKRASG